MSIVFVQGDTAPDITAVIHDEADASQVVNLTSCTVKFQMRKADDRRFTVNATATIVTAALGKVKYSWAANDLATPGEYQVQWEVTYPDTKIQTTAPVETVTVRRQ